MASTPGISSTEKHGMTATMPSTIDAMPSPLWRGAVAYGCP
jgi:hypothetical protein